MEEIWKDVPGYEGLYQVSNMGKVKSLSRLVVRNNVGNYNTKEKILTPGLMGEYYAVSLYSGSRESVKSYKVANIIAMAFLNHKPDGTHRVVVDHIDGCKTNDKLYNLQLLTNRENTTKGKFPNKKGSKYSGVSIDNRYGHYQTTIQINGKNIHIYSTKNEEEAANAYKIALENIDMYNGNNEDFRILIKQLLGVAKFIKKEAHELTEDEKSE